MKTIQSAACVEADRGYRFTPSGLVVTRELTRQEYERVGQRLGEIAQATQWTVGDWLVYGQGLGFAGAKYARAQELTGMTYDVLSQAARVSSAYDIDERIGGVSWTHHRAALSLPTGERLTVLRRVAAEKWTAVMLLAFARERQRAITVGLPLAQMPSPTREAPHVRLVSKWRPNRIRRRTLRVCPKCGHRWEPRSSADEGETEEVGSIRRVHARL
jgi:hypothetical protein